MKGPVILQTDFSTTWSAVATMKGVIKTVDKDIEIVDLNHDIRNFDPFEASLSLAATVKYWPKGSIFVSVVDPGVGTSRKASVAKLKDGKYLISPDNGSFTHMKHDPGIEEIRELDETICRLPGSGSSSVFHGRDIFAYTAALLASGKYSFEELGESYPVEEVVESDEYYLTPEYSPNRVKGILLSGLKHFGSIATNIPNDGFERNGFREGDPVHILITCSGERRFEEEVLYAKSFGYVQEKEPVLYKGSGGMISLDCNKDSFMERYQIGYGKNWEIEIWK